MSRLCRVPVFLLFLGAVGITACSDSASHPDLSGTWDNGGGIAFINPQNVGNSICVVGCPEIESAGRDNSAGNGTRVEPSRPQYQEQWLARVEGLKDRQVEEDPVLRCYPPGVPRIGPPDKIVQTETEIVFLYDDVSGNFFRVIPVDGRGHRDDVEPSFHGDAIGWWEGDTLVVESVNFNDESWLTDDGAFHSTDLRVVEHLHLDQGELVWTATAYDPEILAEPWEVPERRATPADHEILEAPLCLERDLQHMVDDTYHANPR